MIILPIALKYLQECSKDLSHRETTSKEMQAIETMRPALTFTHSLHMKNNRHVAFNLITNITILGNQQAEELLACCLGHIVGMKLFGAVHAIFLLGLIGNIA